MPSAYTRRPSPFRRAASGCAGVLLDKEGGLMRAIGAEAARGRGLLRGLAIVVLVVTAWLGAVHGGLAEHPSLTGLMLTDSQVPIGFISEPPSSAPIRVDGYSGLFHQWIEPDHRQPVALLRIVVLDAGQPDYAARGVQADVAQFVARGLRPVSVPGTPGATWLYTTTSQTSTAVAFFTRGSVEFETILREPAPIGIQPTLGLAGELTHREQELATAHYKGATSATPSDTADYMGGTLGALIGYLIVLDAWAYFRDPLRRRRRRGQTPAAPIRTGSRVDVDDNAKRQKRRARWFTYIELAGASLIVDALLPMPWQARAALAVAGLVVIATTARVRSYYMGRNAGSSAIRGQRPIRAILLSAAATVMALFGAFVIFDYVIAGDQSPGQQGYAVSIAASLAAAGLMQRRARRISAISARSLLRRDTRGMVLYLRSFDDDQLRLRTATFGRRGLLERLSPNRFDTYEEVLVRHLSALGPVVAINPPGTFLPPIGAARESLPEESWQSVVGEWMDSARLIVMSTPPGTLSPGLQWELNQLSDRQRWQRTLIVTPPVTDQEMWRRWNALAATGPDEWPFRELPSAEMASVLALTRHAGVWTTFNASDRTEWSYSAALRAATENVQAAHALARAPHGQFGGPANEHDGAAQPWPFVS